MFVHPAVAAVFDRRRRLEIDAKIYVALVFAAKVKHCRYDSNQGYSELNHEEQGNQLMDDAHFNFSLLTSTPTHNATC